MAVDTRNKRASAVDLTLPWRGLLPLPDNTIDSADMYQVAGVYAGIEADAIGGGGVPAGRSVSGMLGWMGRFGR